LLKHNRFRQTTEAVVFVSGGVFRWTEHEPKNDYFIAGDNGFEPLLTVPETVSLVLGLKFLQTGIW